MPLFSDEVTGLSNATAGSGGLPAESRLCSTEPNAGRHLRSERLDSIHRPLTTKCDEFNSFFGRYRSGRSFRRPKGAARYNATL